MPSTNVEWIAFGFSIGVLGILSWYGFSSVIDWAAEKWALSRFGWGGRRSIYDNFVRPPTLESEPAEEKPEEQEEHPYQRDERLLEPFTTHLAELERRFSTAQQSMTQMSGEVERQRQQIMRQFHVPGAIINYSGTITRRMDTREERPRVATNPSTCNHMWQDIATSAGRSFRICGLCGTTEDAGLITMPPTPACSRHVWSKPTMTLNAQREIIRQFLCEKCGRTKTERVKQMTIEEAKAKRVRSIFLED